MLCVCMSALGAVSFVSSLLYLGSLTLPTVQPLIHTLQRLEDFLVGASCSTSICSVSKSSLAY